MLSPIKYLQKGIEFNVLLIIANAPGLSKSLLCEHPHIEAIFLPNTTSLIQRR